MAEGRRAGFRRISRSTAAAASPRSLFRAELLGHARLETTRVYTRPTAEDRGKAVDLLPIDE